MNQTLRLSAINVYPVKSMRGISVPSWRVVERGLDLDRRWMVVDGNNKFLTQRQIPRLSLVNLAVADKNFILDAPSSGRIKIPQRLDSSKRVQVRVWDDQVQAIPAGSDVSEWLSAELGVSANLVYMPEETKRYVKEKYAVNRNFYSFADAFPFLILSEGSLEDLNRRLKEPLPMNRFRPSLVLSGCGAFDEDSWKEIRIGNIEFHIAKSCSRCSTTTVDQATGKTGKEPLKTLATFRERDGNVYFGQNAIHRSLGTLTVGEAVSVLQTATPLFR